MRAILPFPPPAPPPIPAPASNQTSELKNQIPSSYGGFICAKCNENRTFSISRTPPSTLGTPAGARAWSPAGASLAGNGCPQGWFPIGTYHNHSDRNTFSRLDTIGWQRSGYTFSSVIRQVERIAVTTKGSERTVNWEKPTSFEVNIRATRGFAQLQSVPFKKLTFDPVNGVPKTLKISQEGVPEVKASEFGEDCCDPENFRDMKFDSDRNGLFRNIVKNHGSL